MISSHRHCHCRHHLSFSPPSPILKWNFVVVRVPRFPYLHLHCHFTILYKVIVQIAFSVYYLYLTTISLGSALVVFETFPFSIFRCFFIRSFARFSVPSIVPSHSPPSLAVWNWDKRRDCFELKLSILLNSTRFFLRFFLLCRSLIKLCIVSVQISIYDILDKRHNHWWNEQGLFSPSLFSLPSLSCAFSFQAHIHFASLFRFSSTWNQNPWNGLIDSSKFSNTRAKKTKQKKKHFQWK